MRSLSRYSAGLLHTSQRSASTRRRGRGGRGERPEDKIREALTEQGYKKVKEVDADILGALIQRGEQRRARAVHAPAASHPQPMTSSGLLVIFESNGFLANFPDDHSHGPGRRGGCRMGP